jgi:hypothetical protein
MHKVTPRATDLRSISRSRRAARRFKAAQQLAYLAWGIDDAPVTGGR